MLSGSKRRKKHIKMFLRYGTWQAELFAILQHLLPFHPPNNPENQNFVKKKNTPGNINLHVCHKWKSYDVWFLRYGAWRTEFFVILDHFLSFYPANNLENQKFVRIKKTPGDIIILHKCTMNGSHDVWFLIYGAQQTGFFVNNYFRTCQ